MPNAGEDVRREIQDCLRRGDVAGAIRGYLQLLDEQPEDWASINALGDLYLRQGDVENAVTQFVRVADFYSAEGFLPRAAALYRKILKSKYDDLAMLSLIDVVARQGHLGEAREYLIELERTRRASGDAAGADECLESLERLAEAQGALPTLEVVDESSFEIAAPEADPTDEELAALIGGDMSAVETLTVETIDEEPAAPEPPAGLPTGQAGEPPLDAGRSPLLNEPAFPPEPARPAVDAGAPALPAPSFDPADLDLGPAGFGQPSAGGSLSLDDLPAGFEPGDGGAHLPAAVESKGLGLDDLGLELPSEPAAPSAAPARSPLLARRKKLPGRKSPAGVKKAKPLQSIFDQMRETAEKEQDNAHERFDLAQYHLRDGREDEAIALLHVAVQSPVVRFKAAAQLGRLYLWRGDLPAAIQWLEHAAEVPPVSPDEGHAVLYELADALEQQGEPVRALAVLIELEAQRRSYRDVPRRIARLSAVSDPGSANQ